MNLYHHNKILYRTIYDPNTYIDHPDEGYPECITYNKDSKESGRVFIDLNKKDLTKQYKIYVRKHGVKRYALITINGKKHFLHRFLLGLHEEEYTLQKVVDHINGDSLDNRIENLRICTQKENMCNIRKKSSIVGVSWYKAGNQWSARAMHNYKPIHIGYFNTYEEAIYARVKWEKENFGDYGPNRDLFYILDLPSPIEELKKFLRRSVTVLAESLAIKNYNWDKADGYWVPEDTNLYASYIFKPNDSSTTVLDKLIMHSKRFASNELSGGQAAHINLAEHLTKEQYEKLLTYAAEVECSYFTFNIPNCECNDCGFIAKQPFEVCPKCGSTHVSLWDRIIGYLTKISNWSEGRQVEQKTRVYEQARI